MGIHMKVVLSISGPIWQFFVVTVLAISCVGGTIDADEKRRELLESGSNFEVNGRTAFLIPGATGKSLSGKAWVWYAPTLPRLPGPEERWMFEQFVAEGISIAGIDAGESYGSPDGNLVYDSLYQHLTKMGYSSRPVMLGRSRGGLMTLSWAFHNPDRVAAFAGIYPVMNIGSYPGVGRAAAAFQLSAAELTKRLREFNPVDNLQPLADRKVPMFVIHGDVDKVVPLELNTGLVVARYRDAGASLELVVPNGQGHNMWRGFFQCKKLVEFVIRHAHNSILPDSDPAATE